LKLPNPSFGLITIPRRAREFLDGMLVGGEIAAVAVTVVVVAHLLALRRA
jgi:hypothetical protein